MKIDTQMGLILMSYYPKTIPIIVPEVQLSNSPVFSRKRYVTQRQMCYYLIKQSLMTMLVKNKEFT